LFIVILVVVIECNPILGVTILWNILYYFLMEILVGTKEYKGLKKENNIRLPRLNNQINPRMLNSATELLKKETKGMHCLYIVDN
jgi:hypothetical protein